MGDRTAKVAGGAL